MYELTTLSIIALCLVSFIGVPHGSFDGAVAALLGFQSKKKIYVIYYWIYFDINCGNSFLGFFSNNLSLFVSFNEYRSFWFM